MQINSVCSNSTSKLEGMTDNGFRVLLEILMSPVRSSQCGCEVRCGETVVTRGTSTWLFLAELHEAQCELIKVMLVLLKARELMELQSSFSFKEMFL